MVKYDINSSDIDKYFDNKYGKKFREDLLNARYNDRFVEYVIDLLYKEFSICNVKFKDNYLIEYVEFNSEEDSVPFVMLINGIRKYG